MQNVENPKWHWYKGMEEALATITRIISGRSKFENSDSTALCRDVANSVKNLSEQQKRALEMKLQTGIRNIPTTFSIHGSRFYFWREKNTYKIEISQH